MARISKEEQKRKHEIELVNARVKKYHENHNIKRFASLVDGELLVKLNNALCERGLNKRQFLEDAIDQFLKGRE